MSTVSGLIEGHWRGEEDVFFSWNIQALDQKGKLQNSVSKPKRPPVASEALFRWPIPRPLPVARVPQLPRPGEVTCVLVHLPLPGQRKGNVTPCSWGTLRANTLCGTSGTHYLCPREASSWARGGNGVSLPKGEEKQPIGQGQQGQGPREPGALESQSQERFCPLPVNTHWSFLFGICGLSLLCLGQRTLLALPLESQRAFDNNEVLLLHEERRS